MASADDRGFDEIFLQLNISGKRYTMSKHRASKYEYSLFEKLANYDPEKPFSINGIHYNHNTNEFFVERSPIMFDIILHFMCTHHVSRPAHICIQALEEEFRFWNLDYRGEAPACCGGNDLDRDNIDMTPEISGDSGVVVNAGIPKRRRLDGLWIFCEKPESSRKALVFNLICIISILISIANLVIGTMPRFQHCHESIAFVPPSFPNITYAVSDSLDENFTNDPLRVSARVNDTKAENHGISSDTNAFLHFKLNEKYSHFCDGGLIFDFVELACIIWFTIEITLRFVSCPDKRAFVKSPLNIIDFLATFPFYIEIGIWACGLITDLNRVSSVSSILLMLRVMRVLRAFRILRLARYFDSLQIMGETLWESRRDMGLLVLFLAVGVLIFSTILFYVEKDVEGTAYTSIPAAFWWAIVTLTTTGYGDVTPQTTLGKSVAGVACIAGVLILAFPVSILVEHFRLSYDGRRRNALVPETTGSSSKAPAPGVLAAARSTASLAGCRKRSGLTRRMADGRTSEVEHLV